jgi:hypothetical protein
MRSVLLSLVLMSAIGLTASAVILAAPAPIRPSASPSGLLALQTAPDREAPSDAQPAQNPAAAADRKIDVTVNQRGGTVWYHNPVWIAIGILALIVVLLLIVLIARGGDTTVIRG